jgi:ferredoxin
MAMQSMHPSRADIVARESPSREELRVDRIACTGHGICASILLGSVRLDEWGYPLLTGDAVDDDPGARAAAVRLCPAMALYLAGQP